MQRSSELIQVRIPVECIRGDDHCIILGIDEKGVIKHLSSTCEQEEDPEMLKGMHEAGVVSCYSSRVNLVPLLQLSITSMVNEQFSGGMFQLLSQAMKTDRYWNRLEKGNSEMFRFSHLPEWKPQNLNRLIDANIEDVSYIVDESCEFGLPNELTTWPVFRVNPDTSNVRELALRRPEDGVWYLTNTYYKMLLDQSTFQDVNNLKYSYKSNRWECAVCKDHNIYDVNVHSHMWSTEHYWNFVEAIQRQLTRTSRRGMRLRNQNKEEEIRRLAREQTEQIRNLRGEFPEQEDFCNGESFRDVCVYSPVVSRHL